MVINRKHILLIATLVSVVLAAVVGCIVRIFHQTALDDTALMLIGFPGNIFMQCLKMVVLPLLITSIISGLAQLDTRQSGRMGWMALSYYFTTTTLAVIVGIALMLIIQPGKKRSNVYLANGISSENKQPSTLDTALDLIRNMFPENLVRATLQQVHTTYKDNHYILFNNGSAPSQKIGNYKLPHWTIYDNKTLEYVEGMNVLGLIAFCICFGIVLGQLREQAKALIDLILALETVIMRIILCIMKISPIGIFSLITKQILEMDSIAETAKSMGWFVLTALTGLIIHGIVVLPFIFFILTRKNPFTYMKGLLQALVTAFGTSSSAATLPVTFRCLESNLHIDKRVTSFVLPIGATVNMDGAALYMATSALFIAQYTNTNMSPVDVIVVSVTATLASIGAAAIPSAALVSLLLVLTAVGLPTDIVPLIFTVDWLLDRVCTTVNVLGDALGAGLIHHHTKSDFEIFDKNATASNGSHHVTPAAESPLPHVAPSTPIMVPPHHPTNKPMNNIQ
ncbi:sodium:dicarboxylate symporter family domain-containing protein [Ditylenchus destructor]|uniref:Amino acid transporter n=1 Tax=Ditylenchus destructor TaxID=166010 RepID=A0AAD4ND55_9BILA|nr:sodium:dicarboxylate symporter family domain-containing protein [Ditylenchus destructor]